MVTGKYLIIIEKLKSLYPEIFTGDIFKDLSEEETDDRLDIVLVREDLYNSYIDFEKEFSITEKMYDVYTMYHSRKKFEIKGIKWVFNFGQLMKMKIIFVNKNKNGSSVSIEFTMKDFDDNILINETRSESIYDYESKEKVFSKMKCKFEEYLEKYVIKSTLSEHHKKIANVLLNTSEFLFSKDCVMNFIDEVGEKSD